MSLFKFIRSLFSKENKKEVKNSTFVPKDVVKESQETRKDYLENEKKESWEKKDIKRQDGDRALDVVYEKAKGHPTLNIDEMNELISGSSLRMVGLTKHYAILEGREINGLSITKRGRVQNGVVNVDLLANIISGNIIGAGGIDQLTNKTYVSEVTEILKEDKELSLYDVLTKTREGRALASMYCGVRLVKYTTVDIVATK